MSVLTHIETADHLQAQTWAHLHNAMSGYQAHEQMRRADTELQRLHDELRAAEHDAELLAAHPVLAELVAGTPSRSRAEMLVQLRHPVNKDVDWPEFRAAALRSVVNGLAWLEAIDAHMALMAGRAGAAEGPASARHGGGAR